MSMAADEEEHIIAKTAIPIMAAWDILLYM
jgi:hypothetical protein